MMPCPKCKPGEYCPNCESTNEITEQEYLNWKHIGYPRKQITFNGRPVRVVITETFNEPIRS